MIKIFKKLFIEISNKSNPTAFFMDDKPIKCKQPIILFYHKVSYRNSKLSFHQIMFYFYN